MVHGSSLSLQATPIKHRKRDNFRLLGGEGMGGTHQNVISVADLCTGGRQDKLLSSHPQLVMYDSDYQVPTYNWNRNKFSEVRQSKLDYISCFVEKTHPPPEQLCKIFTKKHHDIPGPTAYDMTSNWSKKSAHDYINQKGKQYHYDRIIHTAEIMQKAKKAKLPAPNAYKIPKRDNILGPINYTSEQMQWIPSEVWRARQTPGPCYKIQHTQTKPRAPAKLYYPRSKESGGGPGLKGIKNDQLGGPSYYKVNRQLIERKTRS